MTLGSEARILEFRKESIEIQYQFYRCEDTGESFTDTHLDELNIIQLHNLYRERHNLPFPEEIRAIRKQYGISASLMSEILGFGTNGYRQYEQGEVPSLSNGKLIQLAKDPQRFGDLVAMCDSLKPEKQAVLRQKIAELGAHNNYQAQNPANYWFGAAKPNALTGFRIPDLEKIGNMAAYFASKIQPWKTQMNKLLFYADFLHYRKTGYSISGATYKAIKRGPVPENFQSLFEYFARIGKIKTVEITFPQGYIGEQFIGQEGTESLESTFEPAEWETLAQVAESLGRKGAREIMEISHRETGWQVNEPTQNHISYQFAFQMKAI